MGSRFFRRVCALVVVLTVCVPGATRAEGARPNVLIVITDDEAVGSAVATPRLYDWFSGGARFHWAFATTPLCCPSRASIYSGLFAHTHGVQRNSQKGKFDHDKSIQAELLKAGYHTGYFGKFLNNWRARVTPPHFQIAEITQRYLYDDANPFTQAQQAIRTWETEDATPWLVMIGPRAPHKPFKPEAQYKDLDFPWTPDPAVTEADRSDKAKFVRKGKLATKKGEHIRLRQLRTLKSVDDRFMQTIETLTTLGELDNTLVLYLSDNGFLWGQHGLIGKAVPYLPAVQIPMYARGPGIPVGDSKRLVANIDIAPTVYRAAGVTPSYAVEGEDILTSSRTSLLLEGFGSQGGRPAWTSTITANSQTIDYRKGFRECYDLVSDPYELDGGCP